MAVVGVVTPEPTLVITDLPSTSGLLGAQNGDTQVLQQVTGHTILVSSQHTPPGSPPCQKNRANNLPGPSERRAPRHPKRHPASS